MRGPKGEPGLQGPVGPPGECLCNKDNQSLNARYISSGGKRSLHPRDGTVVIESNERVTLLLPNLVSGSSQSDDQYYLAYNVTIKCLSGTHLVVSPDKKINGVATQVALDHGAAKYEFTSTPEGWLMLIFQSHT